MSRYVTRKLLALPAMLLGVSLLVFLAIRALPGDPARLMAGPEATEEAVDAMRHRLGLDAPLPARYGAFLLGALRGDLGTSLRSQNPVVGEIASRIPATVSLALTAYGFAIVIGVSAGMLAAVCRDRWPDQAVMLFAIAGASVANFWLALMGMNFFAVRLGWLPLLGAGSWDHYVLPGFALGLLPTALIARMTRSSMIDVLGQDYVRTARAKGLRDRRVVGRHALRNALIPIVTIVGLNFGSVIGGAVVTETVFNWPGIGRLLVDAVRYRDYPVIEGVTLFAVTAVVLVNFAAEMLIAVLDPRIRFD